MRPELDNRLCEKYPKIFVDRHADMRTTAMCWGFDCHDGWYWLIDQLCASIQSYLDCNPHLEIPQVVATQVKEKWGALAFYINGGDEYICGRIDLAEWMSTSICEECGSHTNVGRTEGYIASICRPCYDKADEQVRGRPWKAIGGLTESGIVPVC